MKKIMGMRWGTMKKILILMIEVGSGHKIPALAVKDAIEEIATHRFRIKVVDFAKESGANKVDHFLKSSWDLALAHPVMTLAINRAIDVFYPITHSWNLLSSLFRDFAHKGIEFIRQFNPDIVYSTHFFCSTIAATARKRHHLSFKVVTTMTDPLLVITCGLIITSIVSWQPTQLLLNTSSEVE